MKKSFTEIIPPLVCSLLIIIFFLPPLINGKVPIPADSILGLYHPWRDASYDGYNPEKFPVKNPLITDPVLQTYPWRNLVIKNIKEGNLPFWNPYSFSGQPLLANVQSSSFQILNILFWVFPFKVAWSLTVILSAVFTSLFMYLFLRSLKLSNTSSAFGAFVMPFTGFFVSWLTWGTIVTTAMWLPLILLSINKLQVKISPWWFLVLIFASSQSILSGHWQATFYIFLAVVLYLAFLFTNTRKAQIVIVSCFSIFLGILISAPQLLPSIEFINFSARSIDQGYSPQRTDWFLPTQNLVQLVAPDFFGNPATYNYWGVWNYAEFASFIGLITLVFVIIGIFKKSQDTRFFLILASISVALALANPISKVPFLLKLPYISSMQPSRIIFLFTFSMIVLSSFGLENFLKKNLKKEIIISSTFLLSILLILLVYSLTLKNLFPEVNSIDAANVAFKNLIFPIVVILTFLIFIIFGYYLKIPQKVLILGIFILTAVELFRFGYKFTPFTKINLVFPSTESLEFLKKQELPFRVMTTDRRIMHPNSSSVYGIESIDGYDPLYLKNYGQFVSVIQSHNPYANIGSFNRIVTPQKLDSPLINLLNVKYILSFDEISETNFVKVFEEGITKIYQNKNVIPRAFFVNEVIKVDTSESEFSKLLSVDIDLTKTATSQKYSFGKQNNNNSVEFDNYQDQSLSLIASTDKEAPLVLTNIHYPGWKAFVDEKIVQIMPVDFMFQSIMVPPGTHQVEFKFRPQSFYNGVYLALFGIFGSVLGFLYLWKRKYQ